MSKDDAKEVMVDPALANGVIKLYFPTEFEGVKYETLNMRRCKGLDMRIASEATESPAGHEQILFANLCDVPVGLMDALDAIDVNQLQGKYRSFLDPAQAILEMPRI